ncbi:hypothetical protein LWI29_014350 [Acer saccharum]|uniref:Protein FAR1-RELATED SEQUENCE n=1 Tax=Acer saccharum TaxID=4024 RepID=A0AA39VIW3_ACESA|nr:hypothetical protein LWI29_014350 [Acer saccharum]
MDSVMYTFKKFAAGDKTWNVRYTPSTNIFKCSCKMFETMGILCSHAFSVMKAMNQHHIPKTLIMQHWTKNVNDVLELDSSSTVTTPDIMQLARYGALSSKCSKMSYFASMSIEGYKEANVVIDKLTIQMKGLLPSSSTAREENVHQSKTESSVQVKDLIIAATKGSLKQKTKSSGKAHKCGNCGQPGHTKKTCHAHGKNNISAMASNGAATTGSTLQPTTYADLVQSCDSEYIVDSDECCQPFAFHNSKVPIGNLSNQSLDNVFSMTSSTQAMYMQQNQWWRPHNLI